MYSLFSNENPSFFQKKLKKFKKTAIFGSLL